MVDNVKVTYHLLTVVLVVISLKADDILALNLMLPQYGSNIVGEIRIVYVQPGDTLYQVARREDVGIVELIDANPGIEPTKLKVGKEIIIPTAYVLPNAPRQGIVINLAELRLYYYPPYQDIVMTFPIGIGREGWETPISQTYVKIKQANPDWRPPESIREHVLKTKGYLLPEVIPAGPDNPLGDYALRLAMPGYLIHGTNQPNSVGKRSSSGCIRLYPEDIEQLYYEINAQTSVYIIHDPFKVGLFQQEFYLEAHTPLPGYYYNNNIDENIRNLMNGVRVWIDWQQTNHSINKTMGYPIFIGRYH